MAKKRKRKVVCLQDNVLELMNEWKVEMADI
jgi:hypothetical protein